MIKIKDIEKLAELSRMKLAPEEKENFAKEIGAILGYASQVQKISTSSEIFKNIKELRNVFREDKEFHQSRIFTEALINEAPNTENNYIKVKKIL